MSTGLEQPAVASPATPFEALLPALARLDERLRRAVSDARVAFEHTGSIDRFRGLYISDREVDRLLARAPGIGAFVVSDVPSDEAVDANQLSECVRLTWLARAFDLDQFDLDALVVALAPELDLRYQRLYAFLQDDVTRHRATPDLILTLLCESADERATRRVHFGARASLLRHGLLRPSDSGERNQATLLARPLEVDEQIVAFVLGQDLIDHRLADWCTLTPAGRFDGADPADVLGAERTAELRHLMTEARRLARPLRVWLYGAAGVGKRTAASTLGVECASSALSLDVSHIIGRTDAHSLLRLAIRTALVLDAVLIVHDSALLTGAMRDLLLEHPGVSVLCASAPASLEWRASDVLVVQCGLPDARGRNSIWRRALARCGAAASDSTVAALASRFRMSPLQICAAVSDATLTAQRRAGSPAGRAVRDASAPIRIDVSTLFAASRAQCGIELESLAQRDTPKHRWEDLVLPDDALRQLHEICSRVEHRDLVVERWGYGRRLTHGGGVNALFMGASGTGKTMAAEVLASSLGLDLFRVDLAGIVSKYIGETEKNLDRVFSAAEHANGIVFFDEADALFGKRSEVNDSHDRYANIEVSYLLQKMERFDGLAILATNLRGNLDEAFIRRLAFSVHFPFPEAAERERIWRGIWPADAPVAPELDFRLLARQFALTGGHIRNIALAAAYLAAQRGGRVEISDVVHATRREYEKLGKTLTTAELGPLAELTP